MDMDLFLRQFGHLSQGEGGIKKLRDVILQLAVQGKLVEQSSGDEPAQALLKSINPKAQVLKGLYEIPNNWVWSKLESVSSYIQRGKGPIYSEIKQIPVVSQKCIQWSGFNFALARFIDPDTLQNYQEERFLVEGDLLWNSTGTGTLGRVAVYPGSAIYNNVVADSHVTIVRLNRLMPRYVWCFLASPIVQKNIEASGSTNQIELSTSTVRNQPIPIPPLAEQKRIEAKVDELMALCDRLEVEQQKKRTLKTQAVQSTLHHLTSAESVVDFGKSLNIIERTFGNWFDNISTVKDLRAAILQLAVQGKLIPQNPADEPASILLKHIDAYKNKLVKEGKIKRATTAPVDDENHPFDLPSGWAWARMGEIYDVRDGTHDSPRYQNEGFPLVTSKDFVNGKVSFDKCKFISKDDHEKIMQRSKVDMGDILFSMIGGNIGNMVLVDTDREFSIKNVALFKYYSLDFCEPLFLKSLLTSFAENVQNQAIGGAQPFVSLGFLRNAQIGVPPLAEQKRIVAKTNELMTLCDQLEVHIANTQNLHIRLMDSLINRITAAA